VPKPLNRDGEIQLGNAPGFGVTFDDSLWE